MQRVQTSAGNEFFITHVIAIRPTGILNLRPPVYISTRAARYSRTPAPGNSHRPARTMTVTAIGCSYLKANRRLLTGPRVRGNSSAPNYVFCRGRITHIGRFRGSGEPQERENNLRDIC